MPTDAIVMDIALASAITSRVPVGSTLVLVPVGATTVRAQHLPLDVDTEIAVAVAELTAKMLRRRRREVLVAPAIPYGVKGDTESAGATSVGESALATFAVEVVRSMSAWADRVVLISSAAENNKALETAINELVMEQRSVDRVSLFLATDEHGAGRARTSMMMHLRPWEVRLPRPSAPSSNEHLTKCSADEGFEILDGLAWSVVGAVLADEKRTPVTGGS